MVLHQGSGSPRRGTVRFHSLELWLFARSGRRLVAHTRRMADFGAAVPNCPDSRLAASMRLLPTPGCRSVYEEWDTALDVGGVLRARLGFAIDNPITQFDPASPERVVVQQGLGLRPSRPGGWRLLLQGRQAHACCTRAGWCATAGRSRFRTDAYGRRAAAGLLQVVSRRLRVDQSRACCGAENAIHHGAAQRRGDLPRRPRAELEQLRVPGLLRAAAQLAESHGRARRLRPVQLQRLYPRAGPGRPQSCVAACGSATGRPAGGPTGAQHGLLARRQGHHRLAHQGAVDGRSTGSCSTACARRPTPCWSARAPCAIERYGRMTKSDELRDAREREAAGARPAGGRRERRGSTCPSTCRCSTSPSRRW